MVIFRNSAPLIRHLLRFRQYVDVRLTHTCSCKPFNARTVTVTIQQQFLLSRIIAQEQKLITFQIRSMATPADPPPKKLLPPESVRGMVTLDKSAFTKTVQVPTLSLPTKQTGKIKKWMKNCLFRKRKLAPVSPIENETAEKEDGDTDGDTDKAPPIPLNRILFDPVLHKTLDDLPHEGRSMLKNWGIKTLDYVDITLTYDNWSYDEVFDAVFPPEISRIGGFSIIGHILHLNLREEQLPFKKLIGEVLYDKFFNVRTVVNKTHNIDNTYRNFSFELLAGEADYVTICKESGFSFEMDFSKVYWNPRLGTEHQRLVEHFQRQDVVYDVFAGIGPFAVPAAKKDCYVLANDLNPQSFRWLGHNMKLNKVKSSPQLFNLDGRKFIQEVLKPDLAKRWALTDPLELQLRVQIIMNLPALAVEFLDAFHGLFTAEELPSKENFQPPTVYCYCFCHGENMVEDALKMASKGMGAELPSDTEVRRVRNVAPGKDMMCVAIKLEKEILIGSPEDKQGTSEEEPKPKKLRHEEPDEEETLQKDMDIEKESIK